MGPRIFFDEIKDKWVIEYGIVPKHRLYFDSKEEADAAFPEVWEKHMNSCDAFKFTASLLCSYAGRTLN